MNSSNKFLTGVFISRLGDSFSFLAFNLILIGSGGSAGKISLFMVARYLPGIVIGLKFRHILERSNKGKWLIRSYLASAAFMAASVFMVRAPIALLIISALLGCSYGIYIPLQKALIPIALSTSEIKSANSKVQLADVFAKTLGFLIAGLCFDKFGSKSLFLADAASFISIAWLLNGICFSDKINGHQVPDAAMCGKPMAQLKLASAIFAVAWLGTGVLFALEASYAKQYLAASEEMVGRLFALATAGSIFTPLLVKRLRIGTSLSVLAWSALAEMLFVFAYALSNTVTNACLCILAYGFVLTLRHILMASWIHFNFKGSHQSSAFAIQQAYANIAMVLGMGASGLITSVLSLRVAIVTSAALSIFIIVVLSTQRFMIGLVGDTVFSMKLYLKSVARFNRLYDRNKGSRIQSQNAVQ